VRYHSRLVRVAVGSTVIMVVVVSILLLLTRAKSNWRSDNPHYWATELQTSFGWSSTTNFSPGRPGWRCGSAEFPAAQLTPILSLRGISEEPSIDTVSSALHSMPQECRALFPLKGREVVERPFLESCAQRATSGYFVLNQTDKLPRVTTILYFCHRADVVVALVAKSYYYRG
jgi:hypothetical protein